VIDQTAIDQTSAGAVRMDAPEPHLPPNRLTFPQALKAHFALPEGSDARRAAILALLATLATLAAPTLAAAQAINLDLGTGGGLTDRVVQLVGLMTVLSLAPSIVMMTTSFVRITVVLSLLRQAIGLQASPPNSVLVSLALFLTAIVMGPTFTQSYNVGIKPLLDHKMELPQAFQASAGPVKTFMLSQVDRDDLALFIRLSRIPKPTNAQATPLTVVTPAYMISELKRAFQIGFLLFIPFLVIDLVVASVLISMGMMMLPPVTVSLPFKLIFFVLVDGWRLVCGSLVESFRHGAGV
jgi:flagellar biosynthesis protein FliP